MSNKLKNLREGMGYSSFMQASADDKKKIVVRAPEKIFSTIRDILYEEDTTLKSFIGRALVNLDEIKGMDEIRLSGILRMIQTYGKDCKASSVWISKDEHKSIRAIEHHKHIGRNCVVLTCIIMLINDKYYDKYPENKDIVSIHETLEHISNGA